MISIAMLILIVNDILIILFKMYQMKRDSALLRTKTMHNALSQSFERKHNLYF